MNSEKKCKINILNILGEQVIHSFGNQKTIDISALNNGLYIVYMQTEKGIAVAKFMKIF
jgi:hypothetical protein